jgi:beta-mannosidase
VVVNGYKIYCKGANYVPPDMLYSRLNNEKYGKSGKIQQLLLDARNSNFNMIRLWGGGQYESNEFYELASRMGIMIFYDFMFSDSIYPSTPEFL